LLKAGLIPLNRQAVQHKQIKELLYFILCNPKIIKERWWQENYITGNKTDWNPPPAKNKKPEIISYLTQAYDDLQKTIKKGSLTEQAVNGVHATIDHITHHRGQAVIYLRTNGVEPPEYMY
jgi:hypothetical protein